MPLLRLGKVSLAFGHRPLLDRVDLELHPGERVCLLGRNGEGKSSLMRVLAGETAPDDGELSRRPGTSVAYLAQEATLEDGQTVFEAVAAGLPNLGELLAAYHGAAATVARSPSPEAVTRMDELQHELEAAGGWQLEQRVEKVLSRLGLEGRADVRTLSGGWQRRVMLARALVIEPDLLLLDEPTNHLDIEAITWLEDFMTAYRGALLFVSHDRAFVRRLATRIVELDRGSLTSWPGDYDDYLRRKAHQLEIEAQQNALFDKKLSREEAWIRQGIKARRTRNEGRVRALKELREQRRQRRERSGEAVFALEQGEASGKLVFDAEGISFGFDERSVVSDFSVRILRGDRVGIIGPNGVGKTTLIRLLLGQLTPDSGSVRRGTKLRPAYFDQQREQLDPAGSVMDNVAAGSRHVTINGRRRHVAGYLRDFLFPAERLQSPVSTLSGGERNRLLLARLFAQPANLLILDEPTNDLDVETLELLEELVGDYQGTLLLVSHDRAFIDNVVTSSLVFEGEGRIREFAGGYSEWVRFREAAPVRPGNGKRPARTGSAESSPRPRRARTGPRKLSYHEQRELAALPARIEVLEAEQSRLRAVTNDAELYRQASEQIASTLAELESVTSELESCYTRWEYLESMSAGKD